MCYSIDTNANEDISHSILYIYVLIIVNANYEVLRKKKLHNYDSHDRIDWII